MPFVEQALVIDARDDDWLCDAMALWAGHLAGGAWDGVEDLHGELRLCWEGTYLYFYLRFVDDELSAPETHPKRLWENDGMQFAFDALANGRSPYDDLRYGMSESPDGVKVQSYSPQSEGVPLNVAVAVRYVGYKRMYEWALPWGDL